MKNRPLLGQLAYDGLSGRLATGQLPAGARLSEKDLGAELGMSKTPIREALRRLEAEGMVEAISNVGYLVTRLTYRDIREAFEAREALEGALARLATERASPQAIVDLTTEFRSDAVDFKSSDRQAALTEMRRLNDLVHGSLLRLADNELIQKTLQTIDMRVRRAIAEFIQDDYERYALSYKQHVAIVDAFESQEPDECERAVRRHIASVATHILERYR